MEWNPVNNVIVVDTINVEVVQPITMNFTIIIPLNTSKIFLYSKEDYITLLRTYT